MGFNTTVVIYNDALEQISGDSKFGEKLSAAIRSLSFYKDGDRADVSAGNHGNAAHVVETHHADVTTVVTVGGNLGVCRASVFGWENSPEMELKLVTEWALKLGYGVVKLKK